MSYLLYKLRFPNGIHIGTASGNTLEETMIGVYSDTFYSALYNEYMKIYNDNELYKVSKTGDFLVSDLFPQEKINRADNKSNDNNFFILIPPICIFL